MTIEQLKAMLMESENHFILKLSDEEIGDDEELKQLKISTLTKVFALKHMISRRENGKT